MLVVDGCNSSDEVEELLEIAVKWSKRAARIDE